MHSNTLPDCMQLAASLVCCERRLGSSQVHHDVHEVRKTLNMMSFWTCLQSLEKRGLCPSTMSVAGAVISVRQILSNMSTDEPDSNWLTKPGQIPPLFRNTWSLTFSLLWCTSALILQCIRFNIDRLKSNCDKNRKSPGESQQFCHNIAFWQAAAQCLLAK